MTRGSKLIGHPLLFDFIIDFALAKSNPCDNTYEIIDFICFIEKPLRRRAAMSFSSALLFDNFS